MARKKLPKHKTPEEKAEALITTWRDRGWIAQVIENEDGGGWAVTMTREGDSEPVYVAPWTMGRNKIDPKPLDQQSFNVWVKSASEFLMRARSQVRDADRQSFTIRTEEGEALQVIFDVQRDEYEAEGTLLAQDVFGNEIARIRVDPRFRLTYPVAEAWVADGFPALSSETAEEPADLPAVEEFPEEAQAEEAQAEGGGDGQEVVYEDEGYTDPMSDEPVFNVSED